MRGRVLVAKTYDCHLLIFKEGFKRWALVPTADVAVEDGFAASESAMQLPIIDGKAGAALTVTRVCAPS